MSENKGYKVIAIVALMLGVVGVTLGYAAFTSTLTISSSAEVKPSSANFNVDFSSSSSSVLTAAIQPELTPSTPVEGFTATDATISNSGDPTITNLHATFTQPGQSVTYRFYSYNAGEYVAYLNKITFSGTKSCTAKAVESPATPATQSLVNAACNGISLSVKVGSDDPTTSSIASLTNHTLGINAAEEVVVTISYAQDAAVADGDFDVTLPSIVLTYDSVE